MEKLQSSENETLKNDFKILKTYARKISGVNKLLVKVLEGYFCWIEPGKKIDSENMTEAVAQELIDCVDIWKEKYDRDLLTSFQEEKKDLQNIIEREKQTGEELLRQLEKQSSLFTRLKDEIISSMNGDSDSFPHSRFHRDGKPTRNFGNISSRE
jgi:hypothetical protein